MNHSASKHSFHRLLGLLFATLLLSSPPLRAAQQIAYRLTANQYSFDADWQAAATTEFGPGATVADWNTIKAEFGGSAAAIQGFMDHLALTGPGVGASVYFGGQQFYNSGRSYFFDRHDGARPSNFLAHDNIQAYAASLGSWSHNRPILVRIVGPGEQSTQKFVYRKTTTQYAFNADWQAAVTNEFGLQATVADWNTIKADFGGSVSALQAFMDSVGLSTAGAGAGVLFGGSQYYTSGRSYFLERHNGTLPANWLAHDQIQAHMADLGSWFHDRAILARIAVHAEPFIGGPVEGEPLGTTYLSFGTPQVGAFSATILKGKSVVPVIIAPNATVLLRAGGSVPGLNGSVITKFGQPSGDAVLATLKLSAANSITAKNNVVLLNGLSAGAPRVAARTGTANAVLPSEVTIRSFGSIDGNGSGIFFLATLQGKNVTPTNAVALCTVLGDGSVKVLTRRGDVVAGKAIATLGTLVGSAGTLGEGRWRVEETTCGVRLTFTGAAKAQALYAIPGTATTTADWTLLAQIGVVGNITAINGAKINSFGLPGFGPGASAAVVANLAITPGGPTAANHVALLDATAGATPVVLFRTGDTIATDANGAPLTGTRIASMLDPAAGDGGKVAFAVNMLGQGGIASRGIMYRKAGQTPTLLANVGAMAPGGGHWSALGALALPDGTNSGPVFLGTLAVNRADGVTAKSNAGLWAVDSTGTFRLLLRSGQSVTVGTSTKTLSKFTSLIAAPGSIGAASTYDNAGRIAVLATCTDGTRALLIVPIP